jgi:hypothetical protein
VSHLKGFGRAMVSVGWLVEVSGGMEVPRFDRWMSRGAKARLGETKRKQMQRGSVPESSGQNPEFVPKMSGQKRDYRTGQDRTEENTTAPPVVSAPTPPPNPTPPSVRDAIGSAGRFLANRQIATGNAPEGFAAFVKAYPTGLALDDDGMLAIWRAKGLEEIRDEVLAGLARWNASEKFQTGHAPAATTFLTRGDWAKAPPPPKPVAAPRYGGGAF